MNRHPYWSSFSSSSPLAGSEHSEGRSSNTGSSGEASTLNPHLSTSFASELSRQLRDYLALCEETLAFTSRENQALTAPGDYQPFAFYQGRKALLSRLDEALNLLHTWRQAWQRLDPAERAQYPEVKQLLQSVQDSLVKILVLDRENQQALLRRGLVPAQHVPEFAARPPHYAAQAYRRHST